MCISFEYLCVMHVCVCVQEMEEGPSAAERRKMSLAEVRIKRLLCKYIIM